MRKIITFLLILLVISMSFAYAVNDECREQMTDEADRIIKTYIALGGNIEDYKKGESKVELSRSVAYARCSLSYLENIFTISDVTIDDMLELANDMRDIAINIDDKPTMIVQCELYDGKWNSFSFRRDDKAAESLIRGIAQFKDSDNLYVSGSFILNPDKGLAAYDGKLYKLQDVIDYMHANYLKAQEEMKEFRKTNGMADDEILLGGGMELTLPFTAKPVSDGLHPWIYAALVVVVLLSVCAVVYVRRNKRTNNSASINVAN